MSERPFDALATEAPERLHPTLFARKLPHDVRATQVVLGRVSGELGSALQSTKYLVAEVLGDDSLPRAQAIC